MYEMDHKDKEILREVLVKWYGPQANGWEMNSAVLRVVLKMVGEIQSCTSVMHLVPTPMTFGNQYTQLAKGYLTKILGVLRDNSQVYLSCARATILGYKTEVAIAAMGL
ncbi:hypothetical protein [Pseudomonas caspiana]|uniref:hypothetical protein n=1 Tax=Pseudomonas caspiana TaxID=1451454 RepID=UPI0032EDF886